MATGIRVLHVDDDPGVVEVTAEYLHREDDRFEVVTATSASAALDVLDGEGDPIDCVVSDYDIPEMDGLTLLDAVRAEYPGLPFILFTGKGSEEVASEAISRGVSDYLEKRLGPDRYTLLANRIVNAVQQHRAEQRVERLHVANQGPDAQRRPASRL